MGNEQFPITKERIAEIAIKFIENSECFSGEYNIKKASDSENTNFCVDFILEKLKEVHHGVMIFLEIEDFIENGESEEEFASDLGIVVSELKDFELHLYYAHTNKK